MKGKKNRPAEDSFRPERVEEAKRKIADGLDKNPEVIDAVARRLLPKIFNGITCWHCRGEGNCNCGLCSPSAKKRPCRICYGQGKLDPEGRPLISDAEFLEMPLG